MEKHTTYIGDTFHDGRDVAPHVVPMVEIERFDQWSDRAAGNARRVDLCYCVGEAA